MHIPTSMLHGGICPVTAAVSVAGVAAAAYCGHLAKAKPTAARFGAITAMIFAGQMMNFPIMQGTSGHLLGGVLAASLLGIPFGILSIALVVSTQSLVFSDGGLDALGANILNMAVLGAGLGGLLRSRLVNHWQGLRGGESAATALAAWVSVMAASLAVSLELAISGQIALATVVPAMVGTHALIGIGEAFLTVACCLLFSTRSVQAGVKEAIVWPLTAAAVVALLLSPFASVFPDGLEWVAAKYNLLHTSAPTFVGLLQDYAIPAIGNERLSIGAAGLIGVAVSFGVAWVTLRILQRSAKARIIAG